MGLPQFPVPFAGLALRRGSQASVSKLKEARLVYDEILDQLKASLNGAAFLQIPTLADVAAVIVAALAISKRGHLTTGSVTASGSGSVVVAFSAGYADADYEVAASVLDASGKLRVDCVTAQDKDGFTVQVSNTDGGVAHTGVLEWSAIHD
jgi:hypothetical protein